MGELKGHTDAIWDLAIHPTSGVLLSCASDGTCRLWNHKATNPQLKLYQAEESQSLISALNQAYIVHVLSSVDTLYISFGPILYTPPIYEFPTEVYIVAVSVA